MAVELGTWASVVSRDVQSRNKKGSHADLVTDRGLDWTGKNVLETVTR